MTLGAIAMSLQYWPDKTSCKLFCFKDGFKINTTEERDKFCRSRLGKMVRG